MAKQNKKGKKWQYILYACFLIFGALLIVGLPQYTRLRQGNGTNALKALDSVCESYDIKILDFRYRVTAPFNDFASVSSDTPAGNVTYFEIHLFPNDKKIDKLQLSSEENDDFESLVWEITSSYKGAMNIPDLYPPQSPYKWRLIEKSSGECLAIWYTKDESQSYKTPEKLYLLSW